MKISTVTLLANGTVLVEVSTSSNKLQAQSLAVEHDEQGKPIKLVLDRLLFNQSDLNRLNDCKWSAAGSFVTELTFNG